MRAIILEDNADRRNAMASILADLLPSLAVEFYVSSQEMIERIECTGIFDVGFISLDNDLDMIQDRHGNMTDAGDGIEVARTLLYHPSIVPVIVHTTNTTAGDQIVELLENNHWEITRVVPYDDLLWVSEVWRTAVRNSLVQRSICKSLSSLGVSIINNYMRVSGDERRLVNDLLKATSYIACDNVNPDDFCLELISLGQQKSLESPIGIGFSLLADPDVRSTVEAFAWENIKAKPKTIAAIDQSLDPLLRSILAEKNIRQLRCEILEPLPKMRALFLVASRCSEIDLSSLQIEETITAGVSLLELGLRIIASKTPKTIQQDTKIEAAADWPVAWRESES